MLTNGWFEVEIARQVRNNQMESAAAERLAKQVANGRHSTIVRLRGKIGTWLVTTGQRLQSPPALHQAHEF